MGKDNKAASKYSVGKRKYNRRIVIRQFFGDLLLLVLGVASASFGLKSFLLPSNFIDGGVTGISLLIEHKTGISLSLLLILINIPFVVLGYWQIGRKFFIKSVLAIAGLAIVVHIIPYPIITDDKLLVSVFGGFFLGAGIGLAMRAGAVLDGTEVTAIYLNKKLGLSIGDFILLFNIAIFSVAAYLIGREEALYSILTYMAASKTVTLIIEGVEEYTGVTIISHKHEEIRTMIIDKLGRGVTVYQGKGGYGKKDQQRQNIEIIYAVVTRLETARLNTEIEKIDPSAFVITNSIKDTKGGMIKKRPFSH
jgi:uncharacterized membrane-anchored protein YitT (DUF2179 family)